MNKIFRSLAFCSLLFSLPLTIQSCFKLRGHYGGPKSYEAVERPLNPEHVALPAGYSIKAVAQKLTYPTAVAFDEEGRLYVIESGYSYGEVNMPPRLLRIDDSGNPAEIAKGEDNGPWTGITFHAGNFYIAEGGVKEGGKILKVSKTGTITRLAEGLPSLGDHHTNGPVIKEGYIYFGIGTATNSGVVGKDNYKFGWLARHPHFHDIPCEDITLTGQNFTTDNPFTEDKSDKASTGAYSPFGTVTVPGQVIKGSLPCSGAIMRIPLEGGKPELVAWGLRNPYGLAFSPEGKLYITENAYDTRGSRPGYGNGDVLWEIQQGTWYGWPDYSAAKLMSDKDNKTPKNDPRSLLAKHPNTPPKPVAVLDVHSSSNGFDFSRNPEFGYTGQAFIAQFGDMAPEVGRIYGPVGFKVVRVDIATGVIEDFAVNKGRVNAPASQTGNAGLERPIAAKFDASGKNLYVVDFGIMPITKQGEAPKKNTGVIWKISREAQ